MPQHDSQQEMISTPVGLAANHFEMTTVKGILHAVG
jgi:hypothetical protein